MALTPGQGQGPYGGGNIKAGPAPQPSDAEASEGSEQEERERLRKVLKQMGRLRCPQEVSEMAGSWAHSVGRGTWHGARCLVWDNSPLLATYPTLTPGLRGRLLQPHGLPVPPATLWKASL